jgi:hypothetical protein
MRLRSFALLLVLVLAATVLGGACTTQITGGRGAPDAGTDPGPNPRPDDAGPGPGPGVDAMPAPLCAKRSVFLSFDGQTLTRGSSDATMNRAEWMTIASGTAPPYLAGNANRDAAIQTIVDGVRAQLSRFPITVVTRRPATGSYMMIVYGGSQNNVGSRYIGAVNQLDCDGSRPNDVAWMGDNVTPPQRVINYTIGAIGFGLGLTATNDPNDCMCGWDNGCRSPDTAACNLGSPINRDQNANQQCPGVGGTQDEVGAIRTAFCQ